MRDRFRSLARSFEGWFDENTNNFKGIVFIVTVLSVLLSVFLLVEPVLIQHRSAQVGEGSGKNQPNIILIIADALSAEDISLFGYSLPTTPRLTLIAHDWTVYTNMQSSQTCSIAMRPMVTTGRYPYFNEFYRYGDLVNRQNGWMSASEALGGNGYNTWWLGYLTPGYYRFGPGYNKNLCSPSSLHEWLYRSRFKFAAIIRPKSGTLLYTPWLLGLVENIRLSEGPRCGHLEDLPVVVEQRAQQGWFDDPFFLYVHESGAHFPYNGREFAGAFLAKEEGLLDEILTEEGLRAI